jgi:hypothetical protein
VNERSGRADNARLKLVSEFARELLIQCDLFAISLSPISGLHACYW